MSNEKISVIITVYNVEKYLPKCLDSIINQTYQNLEIICIDDGSTDSSPQILKEYAQKDSRIKIITSCNEGQSAARNKGLKQMTGVYVSFVDSDDWLDENTYEKALSHFTKDVDSVCWFAALVPDTPNINITSDKKKYHDVNFKGKLHLDQNNFFELTVTVWNKIYRKEVIGDIRFPEDTVIDDEFWTYKVIGRARSLIYVEKVLYAYRQQNQSIMHTSFSLNRLQAIKAQEEKLEYMAQNLPELRFAVHEKLWLLCLYLGQMSLKYLQKSECKEAIRIIELTLEKHPFSKDELLYFNFKYKIWWYLSKCSIELVCKIRNFLKIGE